MSIVSVRAAKSAVAAFILPSPRRNERLGSIQLRDHQADGVTRILVSIAKYGGALLCDEVGLGKTFTAAAVMRRFESALVIAPAALLPMWKGALLRSQLAAQVMSLEQFSRTSQPASTSQLVVIDEAHHLRNPATVRFRNIAAFIAQADVLLLSATPLHNTAKDLTSLLSLFLGSSASDLSSAELAHCVIRRSRGRAGIRGIPGRVHVEISGPSASDDVHRKLIALPPPVPPRDGDEAPTLVQFTLLRQWASSDAALREGLKTRIARATALIAALDCGTFPTRREIASWITADLDVQLGFPELLAAAGGSVSLRKAVVEHEIATRELLDFLDRSVSTDLWRADYLRDLRRTYGDRKIVAFTQFASTATALYRLMSRDGKIALVTAGRCEIASGRVSRHDVISRFAPRGTGSPEPPAREQITMLIATDLCSEGLNLQDAGVVVHLDMPWTPARIEQRVGRIARTGSTHSRVFIHTIRTPVITESLLHIEQRLLEKSVLTQACVGAGDESIPGDSLSVPDANELLHQQLASWTTGPAETMDSLPLVAATASPSDCFVAVYSDDSGAHLICGSGVRISDDPRDLVSTLEFLSSEDRPLTLSLVREIAERIEAWADQRLLAARLNVSPAASSARRKIARQISRASHRIKIPQRARAAVSLDQARKSLSGFQSVATEKRMRELSAHWHPDEDFVREIAAAANQRHKIEAEPSERSGFQLLVLLVGLRR